MWTWSSPSYFPVQKLHLLFTVLHKNLSVIRILVEFLRSVYTSPLRAQFLNSCIPKLLRQSALRTTAQNTTFSCRMGNICFLWLYDSLWLNATLYTAKSPHFWHWGLIYSIHRAGDIVIDEEIKSFTKLERTFWMGIFIFFLPRCKNVNSWEVLWCWQKVITKMDLPPKCSLIILQMHYFCCINFLVYFMLCSSWEEIENILSTFSKKTVTLTE